MYARRLRAARLTASLPLSSLIVLAALQGGGCGSGIDDGDIDEAMGVCQQALPSSEVCMVVSCANGAVVHERAPNGTQCRTADTGDGYCHDGACASCADGRRNGDETGIDCGGHCGQCNGATCKDGKECQHGSCVDGVCCDTACDGQCYACDLPGSVGQCTPIPAYTDDAANGCSRLDKYACNGSGACLGLNTHGCDNGEDCISGECRPSTTNPEKTVCKGQSGKPCKTNDACLSGACASETDTCK
jgi:hypothetical protein